MVNGPTCATADFGIERYRAVTVRAEHGFTAQSDCGDLAESVAGMSVAGGLGIERLLVVLVGVPERLAAVIRWIALSGVHQGIHDGSGDTAGPLRCPVGRLLHGGDVVAAGQQREEVGGETGVGYSRGDGRVAELLA